MAERLGSPFYTPAGLAAALISLLPDREFDDAVDICCGSWNLLRAVRERWPHARITGVDVDPASNDHAPELSTFFLSDGRMFALKSEALCHLYDLVVANPPFGRIEMHGPIDDMFRRCFCLTGRAASRLENEMLIANSILVKPNGHFVAIVPSSLVEASSQQSMRLGLLRDFVLEHVVQLPENAFGYRGIHCYALILVKRHAGAPSQDYTEDYTESSFMRATYQDSSWQIGTQIGLLSDAVVAGVWKPPVAPEHKFGGLRMFRGAVSSRFFTDSGTRVLHSSGLPVGRSWTTSVRFVHRSRKLRTLPRAHSGDLIVGRVGRSAGYFCLHSGRATLVSDCLIVLRSPQNHEILKYLTRSSIAGRLEHLVKGVSVRYVTEHDLRSWLAEGDL